ncbi:hypothetical protein [Vibrio pectenicida]|uniref:hypothetical protein n=1 Tax=Vibrio pectenicida TaxID=62763 RepID=UPI001C101ACD|nr:hypothetical protein [Vibrio pectenicida]
MKRASNNGIQLQPLSYYEHSGDEKYEHNGDEKRSWNAVVLRFGNTSMEEIVPSIELLARLFKS